MFNMSSNPLAAYRQVSIDSSVQDADPHQLIILLFDGAIEATHIARLHLGEKDFAGKGKAISNAMDIISNGLSASLNVEAGGELAERLSSLYDYMVQRLLFANLKNDRPALDEVGALLSDLRAAWAQIAPNAQEAA